MRVAIVGGGIGGLTLAIALRQRGIECDVHESASAIGAVGAGIMVPPNAMQVLARLGLADAVRAKGMEILVGEMRDARDGVLQQIDLAAASPDGMTTVAIHRARLQQILLAQLPPASLHVDRRCRAITESDGVASAEFDDGPAVTADVMVGADGLHSAAREYVRPSVPLRYSGQSAYRGVARVALGVPAMRTGAEVWAPGLRVGYGAIAHDEVYWFATIDAPAGDRGDAGHMRDNLLTLVKGFPPPVPALIAATAESAIIRTDVYDFDPFRGWYRGRVVLTGDAAHATTPNLGQGGAQAIEDAWVLAAELARGGDTASAFQRYEAIRWPKARAVVERSRKVGRIVHMANPVARAARNFVLRRTPERLTLGQMRSLFTLNY